VTRIASARGPYDLFAIRWGYGRQADTPAEEQAALDRLAAASVGDRTASRDRLAAAPSRHRARLTFSTKATMDSLARSAALAETG
jgi:hypothetical protein